MMQLIKTNLNNIDPLRINYLSSLPEFQELYLELLIEDSEFYQIYYHENLIGYFAKTTDNVLVEFFIHTKYVSVCSEVFQYIIDQFSISKVYCKSFDFLLLNCCLIYSNSYKLIGTLFRDYFDTDPISMNNLEISIAEHSDYQFLLQQEGELYETPAELERFILAKNILMFKKHNQLLGCGYLIKVHKNWDYYDVGMWVNPDFRRGGIASQIISFLKHTCLTNNWKPICGCAIDNIASQKVLEKNGFVSKHKLIEFEVTIKNTSRLQNT